MFRPKSTLEQWRILQAVVDYGGYAQAAQHLNKSQSSLNHAVSKLQSMLNVQLLEVIGRKAVLTPAGEVMLRRSRYLTQNVEELEALAININQDWEPEIKLVVDLAYPKALLYPALSSFLPHSRGSRVNIIDHVLTGTEDAIINHDADLVINVNVPKGFLGEPLANINFILVCHPQHSLASMPLPIDPKELAQHLQIVIKDSATNPSEKSGWLKSENRWTVSHFHTAIELLKQQLGFCWLPEHYVKEELEKATLVTLPVEGSHFRHFSAYLVCPSPDNKGPGTQLLEKLILQHRQIDLPSSMNSQP
ncbi:LysR family transcriptional regulator [Glaciecola sp. MH2013]|uniref:LysR family transcriptional regulator n=1 Tax=Glaciecola sp. MH2013 TaxID=2785524 RepID=UPI00189ED193|nr:LysR family transcriptional regulator [Glaciecola sp. MH2013]MBF7072664.1 LysR family transcriptional regulator [Glaciecola sp. MH2013]